MAELIFPDGFQEKTTIAQDDYILMADSEDNNKIKKAKYSYLKGEQGDPGQDGQDGQDGTDGASITSGEFSGNDLVFGKDDGTSVTIENAKTTLQGPEGEEGPEGPEGPAGNGIESITATKAGKITTVTITETSGDETEFEISDGQDGQGSGDVVGPSSSTNEDIALMDGTDGKHIKDGGKKLSDLVQTSGDQTINGTKTFGTSPVVPSKTADATNTGTAVATEAQVYKKQDKIDSSNKLSADNVSNGTNNRVCAVSSSAPSTPAEGDLWYDTTNDKLKTYDGTNWNECGGGGAGDITYADYEYNAVTGTTITINYLSSTLTTSADITVTAGTALKPGLTYLLRVTNSDTSNHTMTFSGTNYVLPASSTVNIVFLALTASTMELLHGGYKSAVVTGLPTVPENGTIYYVLY